MAEAQVAIDVQAKDNASRELRRMDRKIETFGDQARRTGRQVGRSMARVGSAVGLAGTAIGTLAGKTFVEFQSSMKDVQAITGATEEEFESLKSIAKEMGRTTQFSASQAARGLKFLGQAGFDTQESISALPKVLDLASASSTSLGESADIASNIMSGFGIEAENTQRVVDVLAQVSRNANTNVSELGQAMEESAAVAKGAGLTFEETNAALGILADNGIKASKAGTSLKTAIARIQNPTKATTEGLQKLGISADELTGQGGKITSLSDVLETLEENGATSADIIEIFGQEAGPKLAALVAEGSDSLDNLTEKLKKSGGAAEEMADTQMEGLQGALKELNSAFQGLQIELFGSNLSKLAEGAVRDLTEGIRRINEEIKGLKGQTKSAKGPMQELGNQMEDNKNKAGSLGGKIRGHLIPEISQSGKLVKELKQAWQFLKPVLKFVAGLIVDTLVSALNLFNSTIQAVIDTVKFFGDIYKATMDFIRGDTDAAKKHLASAWDNIKSAGKNALTALLEFALIWVGKFLKPLRLLPGKAGNALKGLGGKILSPFKNGVDRVGNLLSRFNPLRPIQNAANNMFNWIRNRVPNFLKSPFQEGVNDVKNLLNSFRPSNILSGLRGTLEGALDFVPDIIKRPFQIAVDAANRLLSNFAPGDILRNVIPGLKDSTNDINNLFQQSPGETLYTGEGAIRGPAGQKIYPEQRSEGGIIGGTMQRGDNIPALLNSGEMVLNRQQQQNLFDMIRSGQGGGGDTINITVQQQPGQDGQSLAKQIKRVLQEEQRKEDRGLQTA